MAISYEELTTKHPCFARGAKSNNGRIHLPISPSCNIECRFCERSINTYEQRPGVASTVIKPNEAIDVIKKSLELCPAIKVAGIAGEIAGRGIGRKYGGVLGENYGSNNE